MNIMGPKIVTFSSLMEEFLTESEKEKIAEKIMKRQIKKIGKILSKKNKEFIIEH